MKDLGLNLFELHVVQDMSVLPVADAWENEVKLDNPDAIAAYKSELASHGLGICALLLHNDFSRKDLDGEIDWVVRCTKLASELGAPVLRIDAVMHPDVVEEWPLDKRIEVFVAAMKRLLAATTSTGVDFGIENHGWPGNDPNFLTRVIKGVDSPRLGNTLDTANFYWSGMPLSKVHLIIEQFAPTTKHCHIKSVAFPEDKREIQRELGWGYAEYCCGVDKGDIDVKRVIGALRNANYQGTLCIENESLDRYPNPERPALLREEVAYLKSLL